MFFGTRAKSNEKWIARRRGANFPSLSVGLFLVCAGCASEHYRYGLRTQASDSPIHSVHDRRYPVAVGGEHPRLDRLERWVHSPSRWRKRWFPSKASVDQSPEELRDAAIESVHGYLAANGLDDVHLDIRRYEPGEQWSRLRANPRISPLWKATTGALSVAAYSIFPYRVFHVDRYDPYTNTLSLNSTDPSRGLYQAAEAKEYLQHPWLGTYTFVQKIPFVPAGHHIRTTNDVLTYARSHEPWHHEKEIYPPSYAKIASSAVPNILYASPSMPTLVVPIVQFAIEGTGGLVGVSVAKYEESRRESLSENEKPGVKSATQAEGAMVGNPDAND